MCSGPFETGDRARCVLGELTRAASWKEAEALFCPRQLEDSALKGGCCLARVDKMVFPRLLWILCSGRPNG